MLINYTEDIFGLTRVIIRLGIGVFTNFILVQNLPLMTFKPFWGSFLSEATDEGGPVARVWS